MQFYRLLLAIMALTLGFNLVWADTGLTRLVRIQALGKTDQPNDIFDALVQSPKSALFLPDGSKLYINALEGGHTLVYSWRPQI